MPKSKSNTFYAVVEKYCNGINVIPYQSLEKATKRFEVILGDSLDPDLDENEVNKIVKEAVDERYWSTCEGDAEQEITLEIQTLTFED
jgi:hypothetical protein